MTHKDPLTELKTTLGSLASLEAVARALGIQDLATQDEQFWTEQRRASRTRFFQMCLEAQSLDLALRPEELEPSSMCQVLEAAKRFLASGADASTVRRWYLARGRMLGHLAQDARRERETLQGLALRVLFVLEEGGAAYLAYAKDGTPEAVAELCRAHRFAVSTSAQRDKAYLQAFCDKNAAALLATMPHLKVKQVKALVGPR